MHRAPTISLLALTLSTFCAGAAQAEPPTPAIRGISFGYNRHEHTTRVDVIPDGLVARLGAGSGVTTVRAVTPTRELGFADVDLVRNQRVFLPVAPTAGTTGRLALYGRTGQLCVLSGTVRQDGSWLLQDADNGVPIAVDSVLSYPTAAGGTELAIALAGDPLADVISAEFTVGGSEQVCEVPARQGCLQWGPPPTDGLTVPVELDEVEQLWEVALPFAVNETLPLYVEARDANDAIVDWTLVRLPRPWDNGDGGTAAVTSTFPSSLEAALLPPRGERAEPAWTLVSDGWGRLGAAPAVAEVDMGAAGDLDLPVLGFQATGLFDEPVLVPGARVRQNAVSESGYAIQPVGLGEGFLCEGTGLCLAVLDGPSGPELAVTAFAEQRTGLPWASDVALELVYDDGTVEPIIVPVEFSASIAAVFAVELHFGEDPVGQDWATRVTLRGTPNRRGRGPVVHPARNLRDKAQSFASGMIQSMPTGGVGGPPTSPGGLSFGSTVQLDPERGPTDIVELPVILYANGSGTKSASSQTSTRPQLL
jgi:hypothetical protein